LAAAAASRKASVDRPNEVWMIDRIATATAFFPSRERADSTAERARGKDRISRWIRARRCWMGRVGESLRARTRSARAPENKESERDGQLKEWERERERDLARRTFEMSKSPTNQGSSNEDPSIFLTLLPGNNVRETTKYIDDVREESLVAGGYRFDEVAGSPREELVASFGEPEGTRSIKESVAASKRLIIKSAPGLTSGR